MPSTVGFVGSCNTLACTTGMFEREMAHIVGHLTRTPGEGGTFVTFTEFNRTQAYSLCKPAAADAVAPQGQDITGGIVEFPPANVPKEVNGMPPVPEAVGNAVDEVVSENLWENIPQRLSGLVWQCNPAPELARAS